MPKLFLDVLGNKKFVEGYQIEDSIAKKWHLKPGDLCPFTGLRVEILSLEIAEKLNKAECLGKEQEATLKEGTYKSQKKEAATMVAKPVAKAKAAVKKSIIKKTTKAKAKPAAKVPVTKKTASRAKPAGKKTAAKAKPAAKASVTKKTTSKAKPAGKKAAAKKP